MLKTNKKGIIWMPIIIIGTILILFIILANIGEICLFNKCFYIISPQFSANLSFFGLAISWILIQITIVYLYIQIFKIVRKNYMKFADWIKKILTYVKNTFK